MYAYLNHSEAPSFWLSGTSLISKFCNCPYLSEASKYWFLNHTYLLWAFLAYTHCFHSCFVFKQQVSGKGVFSFENILNWICYYSYVQCLQTGTETNMLVPKGRREFDSKWLQPVDTAIDCGYSNFHTIETGFWFGKNTDVFSLHFFLFILKPDSSQTKQLSPILPRIVPGQENHSHILWHQVLTHFTHGSARGRRASLCGFSLCSE